MKTKAKKDKVLCACGNEVRYSHLKKDGTELLSCNKYVACLTYDEQFELIKKLNNEVIKYKNALHKIVRVNGMDYEYKSWAKEALE